MPYTLEVELSGMCLVVPSGKDGLTLWGLMVDAGNRATGSAAQQQQQQQQHQQEEHDHGDMTAHIAAVVFFEGQDSPTDPIGVETWRELRAGATISCGDTPAGDIRKDVGKLEGNVSHVHGMRVPSSWLNGGGASELVARVRLVGTRSVKPRGGAKWKYGAKVQQLASFVTCTIEVQDDGPLVVPTSQGDLLLHPRQDKLHVGFHNVTQDQLPPHGTNFPKPKKGEPPAHFHHYKHALRITDAIQPEFEDDGTSMALGVNPYACLTLPGCEEGDPDC